MITATVREQDLQQLFRKLENMRGSLSIRRRREALRKGARPVMRAIKGFAPKSKKVHYRYRDLSAGEKRAGKGKGHPVATYRPGNLRRSVVELRNLGTRSGSVFVGVKKGRGNDDAFYARFQDQGTKHLRAQKFIERGFESAKAESMQLIKDELIKLIQSATR